MALCEVEDVKLYLGIDKTTNDALIEMLIDNCGKFIENYTNRTFDIQEYTEVLDGTGGNRLAVHYAPIKNVLSVVNSYGQEVTVNFTDSLLYLTDGTRFNQGSLNWTVTYEAGFDSVPEDVKQACIELVAYKFKERDRVGINSKTLAGEVISFEKRDIRGDIRNTLASYVRVV